MNWFFDFWMICIDGLIWGGREKGRGERGGGTISGWDDGGLVLNTDIQFKSINPTECNISEGWIILTAGTCTLRSGCRFPPATASAWRGKVKCCWTRATRPCGAGALSRRRRWGRSRRCRSPSRRSTHRCRVPPSPARRPTSRVSSSPTATSPRRIIPRCPWWSRKNSPIWKQTSRPWK